MEVQCMSSPFTVWYDTAHGYPVDVNNILRFLRSAIFYLNSEQ